jgi:hypothetical protein
VLSENVDFDAVEVSKSPDPRVGTHARPLSVRPPALGGRRGATRQLRQSGTHRGRVNVADDAELPVGELVKADVTVHGLGVLHLQGTLDGNLRVQAGGIAVVHGDVRGDAVNTDGHLIVFGVIGGRLHDLGGCTYVDPAARIATNAEV